MCRSHRPERVPPFQSRIGGSPPMGFGNSRFGDSIWLRDRHYSQSRWLRVVGGTRQRESGVFPHFDMGGDRSCYGPCDLSLHGGRVRRCDCFSDPHWNRVCLRPDLPRLHRIGAGRRDMIFARPGIYSSANQGAIRGKGPPPPHPASPPRATECGGNAPDRARSRARRRVFPRRTHSVAPRPRRPRGFRAVPHKRAPSP